MLSNYKIIFSTNLRKLVTIIGSNIDILRMEGVTNLLLTGQILNGYNFKNSDLMKIKELTGRLIIKTFDKKNKKFIKETSCTATIQPGQSYGSDSDSETNILIYTARHCLGFFNELKKYDFKYFFEPKHHGPNIIFEVVEFMTQNMQEKKDINKYLEELETNEFLKNDVRYFQDTLFLWIKKITTKKIARETITYNLNFYYDDEIITKNQPENFVIDLNFNKDQKTKQSEKIEKNQFLKSNQINDPKIKGKIITFTYGFHDSSSARYILVPSIIVENNSIAEEFRYENIVKNNQLKHNNFSEENSILVKGKKFASRKGRSGSLVVRCYFFEKIVSCEERSIVSSISLEGKVANKIKDLVTVTSYFKPKSKEVINLSARGS